MCNKLSLKIKFPALSLYTAYVRIQDINLKRKRAENDLCSFLLS
jgi:hypothetical protein